MFGVVKETGVDDEGLVDYSLDYFRSYPVYVDKSYSFYQALGDRKVGLNQLFNPLALIGILCDAYQRITSKSVTGTAKGEGIVQGGIIIFGADGKPACMYQEETGIDLRVADIASALAAVRQMQFKSKQQRDDDDETNEATKLSHDDDDERKHNIGR